MDWATEEAVAIIGRCRMGSEGISHGDMWDNLAPALRKVDSAAELRGRVAGLKEADAAMCERWHKIAPKFQNRERGLERGVSEMLDAVRQLSFSPT